MDQFSYTDPLIAARAVAEPLAAAGDEIEQTRRIPEHLLSKLHDGGLFRMLLPRDLGGGEVEPGAYVLALEEIAQHDAYAIKWTRLSCSKFRNNEVRLQLHALAYNLANFMRTLALPEEVAHWSLTTLREKLVKIGAKVVRHGRYVTFQLAEVAMPGSLFEKILGLIDDLRRRPVPV